MFITPIVFPMPESGLFAKIVYWNPVTPVLVTTRDWMTGAEASLLPQFLLVAVSASIVCIFSWVLFRLTMPYVIERLGS
jgi:lipopolysaccharide transport system permease protein